MLHNNSIWAYSMSSLNMYVYDVMMMKIGLGTICLLTVSVRLIFFVFVQAENTILQSTCYLPFWKVSVGKYADLVILGMLGSFNLQVIDQT